MNTTAVVLKNITKQFRIKSNKNSGDSDILIALKDISFEVQKGQTVGIIGLNGSGKTTLLRVISGIYPPDSGEVRVNGRIAPLLQIGIGFNNELDAIENIIVYGMLLGFTKSEISKKINDIIEFAELEKFRNMKLKQFSAGMRVRLAFSTALQVDPDILLVDEVLSVGDILFRKKSYDSFISFKNKNKTIIFTSHNLDMIATLSDHVILINKGEILMQGKPNEVIQKFKELAN